jgi:glucokinase
MRGRQPGMAPSIIGRLSIGPKGVAVMDVDERNDTDLLVGVDIGGSKVAMGLVSPGGRIVGRAAFPISDGRAPLSDDEVAYQVSRFLAAHAPGPPAAIGVSIAAVVKDGTVLYAPNLPNWEGRPLAQRWRQIFGCPVSVVYDGHAWLAGEAWLGAGRGYRHIVLVVMGTGVGGAVMIDGHIALGRDHVAGAIGWIPMASAGDSRETLEQRIAGPAVARRLSHALGRAAVSEDLVGLAEAGNQAAHAVLSAVLEDTAQGLVTLISLGNPEMIILGGGLGLALARYADALLSMVERHAQPIAGRHLRLVAAQLGGDAGWIGAARFARE